MTDIVLNTITSGYNLSLINDNFNIIQSNINTDAIKRAGGNNVMGQDLDLNSNDLLNVKELDAETIRINGSPITTSEFVLGPNTVGTPELIDGAVTETKIDPTLASDLARYSVLAGTSGAGRIGILDAGGHFTSTNVEGALNELFTGISNADNSPEKYGAIGDGINDDSVACQAFLDANAGKLAVFTPGKTYLLSRSLLISSGTTIVAYGATFNRVGTLDNFFRNKADGVSGGYTANNSIKMFGGLYDSIGGTGTPSGNCTVIAFGHANDILLYGLKIYNENQWHHIEINASSNVVIHSCIFNYGKTTAYQNNEAIQIDSADNIGQFPWFGPYDNFPCLGIVIRDCVFQSVGNGIGTHSIPGSFNHNNILITGCTFSNIYYAGIKPYYWSNFRIIGNRFDASSFGISGGDPTASVRIPCNDFIVSGNSFYNISDPTGTFVDCRAIKFTTTSGYKLTNFKIVDNNVLGLTGTGSRHAITIDYGQHGSVSNNLIDSVNGAGIYVYAGADGVVISNNQVYNSNLSAGAYYGIMVGNVSGQNANRVTVIGNYCDTMFLNYVQRTVVIGNNCYVSLTSSNTTDYHAINNLALLDFA